MQLVRNFLGEEFAAGRKTQLIPAFFAGSCSLFRKLWRCCVVLYRRWLGERIIFGGEDGFIIKENFEFVKNGKKDGQKGQGWIFVMLNIRNFGLTF